MGKGGYFSRSQFASENGLKAKMQNLKQYLNSLANSNTI